MYAQIESSIFESIPKGLVVDVMRHLGDSTGDMSIRGSADFKSTAFRVLLEFLEEVNKNSLMHLSIATESTADVVSISNIHRSRNEPSLSADSMMSFQKEMTDMYQQEQTKILRFAHLADETVSYDSHLKEVHIIPLSREDSTGEGSSKTLSNISVKRLREIWQGLKAPVRIFSIM